MTDFRLILSSPGRLTARALPYLPSTLIGGAGIDVAQVGTTYTISWNPTKAGFSALGLQIGAAADAAAAQALLAIAPRIITAAGTVTVTATDAAIILNKALPTPTPIQLPLIVNCQGLPLLIADFAGNGGEITIMPATGERIMGLAPNVPWVIGSGGNDSLTKVLLHFDGADASTTITDSNAGGAAHTWTANGNAQIDTADSKFGGASSLYDGTGDYVTMPDHADLTISAGIFTVDFWFKCNAAGGTYQFLCGQCDSTPSDASTSWRIGRTDGNFIQAIVCVGASARTILGTTQFTNAVNTGWHHCALIGDGTNIRLFIDGVQEGSTTAISGTINDSSNALSVGRIGEYINNPWTGWIDEFRLSVGVARWVGNFLVPSSEYITASAGLGGVLRLLPVTGIGWVIY